MSTVAHGEHYNMMKIRNNLRNNFKVELKLNNVNNLLHIEQFYCKA